MNSPKVFHSVGGFSNLVPGRFSKAREKRPGDEVGALHLKVGTFGKIPGNEVVIL